MPHSPLALAALATVAVPGLDAYDVRRYPSQGTGIDAAVVIDAESRRWVVRAPQDASAGAALEAELALLQVLVGHVDKGHLPFDVPRVAGFAQLPEGGRAVVHLQLPGRPLQLERLGPGPGLAAALGRAIAALHELPHSVAEDAGLPVYDAQAYRRRRLAEVDEAAGTGKVPPALLRRWERALEDVALWRFQPTIVHGDLSAEHVLCSAVAPTGVLGWTDAKVADPADDLAWLLVAAPHEAVDPILEAYSLRRTELKDPHLASRALLAGELALARWLLHGVRAQDQAIIDDATAMLVELDEHTAAADPLPSGAGGPSTTSSQEAPPVPGAPDDDPADLGRTEVAQADGAQADGAQADGAETGSAETGSDPTDRDLTDGDPGDGDLTDGVLSAGDPRHGDAGDADPGDGEHSSPHPG